MKKNLLFLLPIGLALTACEKEAIADVEVTNIDEVKIGNFTYPKDSLFGVFESNSGFSRDRFVFDEKKQVFFISDYDLTIVPSDYITLKK